MLAILDIIEIVVKVINTAVTIGHLWISKQYLNMRKAWAGYREKEPV